MDEDDDDMVGWEDGGGDVNDAGIVWENGDDDGVKGPYDDDNDEVDWEGGTSAKATVERDALPNSSSATATASTSAASRGTSGWGDGGGDDDEEDDDYEEEPEERRWLGDNGEIVVELPRESDGDRDGDGIDDEVHGTDGTAVGATQKFKRNEKAKPHRFTAEEVRKALNIHTMHLACLVARCSLVSHWAGDPTVQAAMMSCVPSDLIPQGGGSCNANEAGGPPARGGSNSSERTSLAAIVVWFHGFLTIVDDGTVGGGRTEGSWGSRPQRLLRVIDQRVGCAQEAVQLFVALCRGLGLHARYVAHLDPLPPHPRQPGPAKQTRANTVDLAAAHGRKRSCLGRGRRQGERRAGLTQCGSSPARSSRAWAEVLCYDGRDLHVVSKKTTPGTALRAASESSSSRSLKRPRPPQAGSGSGQESIRKGTTALEREGGGVGHNGGGSGGSRATPFLLSCSDEDVATFAKRPRSTASGVKGDCSDGDDDLGHDIANALGHDGQKRSKKKGRALSRAGGSAEGKGEGTAAVGSENGGTSEAVLEGAGNGQLEWNATDGRQKSKIVVPASERGPKAAMSAKRGREKEEQGSKAAAADGLGKTATAAKSSRGACPLGHGEDAHAAARKVESESRIRGRRRDAPQMSQTPTSIGGSSTRRSSPRLRTLGQSETDTGTSSAPVKTNPTKSHESHASVPAGAGINDIAAPEAVSEMPLGEWRAEAGSRDEPKAGVAAGAGVVGGKELETKSADDDCVAAAAAAAVDIRVGGGASTGASTVDVETRWVHVDPVLGAVDQAEKVQPMRFRKRVMPYVVAEDGDGCIVDVTRRYSSEWSRTLQARGRAMAEPDGWWNRALRVWGASADAARSRSKQAGGDRQAEATTAGAGGKAGGGAADPSASEEKELQEKVNKEPIPSTIAALKNHHVYFLAKNLNKFEAVRPGAKATGLVKGCKVYLKSDIAKLRGASRWKQDGLQVKASELDKPAKTVTKKGEKDGEGTSKLYGEWQTESWVPKGAVNGMVPKNEYGNVEFFDCKPAFLPPGTAHVRGDLIGRVAAKLGVDYAPAVTGFETKQGRQVPVLDGIIVCKEHAQMLRDAHTAWEQANLEKQAKARERRVLRRWRILFRGVLLGANLLEEYGDHN